MRRAMMLAGGAVLSLGLALAAEPVLGHPYGPEDEHVNPSYHCGCGDWDSSGSPGYWADGRYYSSYPGRHHRRHHRYYRGYGYGAGYGYQGGYGGYGQGGYPPPAYGPGSYGGGYPPQGYDQGGYGPGTGGYPPGGDGQPGPYDQGGYDPGQGGGYYDRGPQSGYPGPSGR